MSIRPLTVAFIATAVTALTATTAMSQSLSVNATAIEQTDASAATREFTVNVNLASFTGAVGAQVTVLYDDTQVAFVSGAAGSDFPIVISAAADDATNNKVTFATGVDASSNPSGIASGNIAVLTFRTIAEVCTDLDAIVLSTTSALPTMIPNNLGESLSYTAANNVSVTALDDFALVGVPSNVSVPADAGSATGAAVSLTAPTASDSCDTSLSVSVSRSDSASISAEFPIGTTTVTYSATDAAGHTHSADVTVTVANYQLLDASITLNGSISGNSTRSVRVIAGANTQVVSVGFTAGSGTASDVQIPPAATYSCIRYKSVNHSLSNTAAATDGGTQWSASVALDQGDSNDDNRVDILDFGIFVGDFGTSSAGAISNFNDDGNVNNGDFSFISVNFADVGVVCGAYTGGTPLMAISVKELRRRGLGHLAGADLNRDGILSIPDISYYMEHGLPTAKQPRVTPQW